MNIAQSFIFNGDRLIASEDIFGTNDIIEKHHDFFDILKHLCMTILIEQMF